LKNSKNRHENQPRFGGLRFRDTGFFLAFFIFGLSFAARCCGGAFTTTPAARSSIADLTADTNSGHPPQEFWRAIPCEAGPNWIRPVALSR
jgi:hypothetical protein